MQNRFDEQCEMEGRSSSSSDSSIKDMESEQASGTTTHGRHNSKKAWMMIPPEVPVT
jgi:hypothetical protein